MQGHRQKIYQEGGATEKRSKNSKKKTENSTVKPLPGGQRKKRPKIVKKAEK